MKFSTVTVGLANPLHAVRAKCRKCFRCFEQHLKQKRNLSQEAKTAAHSADSSK